MENQNSFTETSTESWGSRIMGSIKSVLFGIVLFLAAFVVLWWNEGRAVKTAKGLKEGANQVVTIDANTLDESNSGKLVHLSGVVSTDELLKDDEFNIETNSLKLRRKVEMYQWVEDKESKKEKELGGSEKTTTSYNYKKEWQSNIIKSNDFKIPEGHSNPTAFPYSPYTIQVNKASIGEYKLSSSLLNSINNFTGYSISKLDTSKIKNASIYNEGGVSISEGASLKQKIFIGKGSYTAPEVGDIKVSFQIVENNNEYSLISKQLGNTFEPYNTSAGTSIQMIEPGIASSENMFESAQKSNSIMTWLLRLAGFLMMFFGLSSIFKPLVVIADVLPFLGDLLNMGLSLFSGIISFSLSFITIAVAWIFYRPILGISLLIIGIGAVVFLIMRARQKRNIPNNK